MFLFKGIIKKIKETSSFNYISQLFQSFNKWDFEDLKGNIKNLLIHLDFELELAQFISNDLVMSLSKSKSLTPEIVKNQLIELLKNHYCRSTEEKKEILKMVKGGRGNVFFIIGSNGVGKTSFIAKLVYYLKNQDVKYNKILLVASDTFRAGAIEQLKEWSQRLSVGIEVPKEKENSGSLIYRTISQKSSEYDLIICDSSGRQYNNQNLLLEIKKQYSIIQKLLLKPPEETLLIIDSTLGIYSYSELKKIVDYIPITGLVLTKMDSTSRGGAVYNLKPTFSVPVKFICYGESEKDMDLFDINSFTDNLINTVFSDDLILKN